MVPNVAGSGLAFNQVISSGAVFGGRSFLPTIHSGEAANSATGCKSLNMS